MSGSEGRETMMAATAAEGLSAGFGQYPVQVSFDPEGRVNRLWGVPLIGLWVRWVALIPHFFVAWLLLIGLSLTVLVSWIPVLVMGRNPFAGFTVGTMRYLTRLVAWGFFLAGPYPPFSLSGPYAVNLDAPTDGSINRLWGIPFLGLWVRGILVIPHVIVAFLLGIVMWLGIFVLWIPILLNGRMPQVGYQIYGGYLRLYARAYLWVLLTPVPYPPITP
jgi:hypothetical protein